MLTPDDVTHARFRATKFREGYDLDEVDDYLDRIVATLRARQAGEAGDVTLADLDTVAFTATRFREGYEMADVDDFLDRVRVELGGKPAPWVQPDAPTPGLVPQRRGLFGRRR